MSCSVQQINDYFAAIDCRSLAHACLTRDYLPSLYRAGAKNVAASLGSFAYGNTPAVLMDELLGQVDAGPEDVFLDLGCGCGLPTLVAATRVKLAVGVDLLPGLLDVARKAAQDLSLGNVDFRLQDLRQTELTQASIVFLAATRFESDLMLSLQQRLAQLRPGARLLSISRPIESRQVQLKARISRRFAWGDLEPEQNYPIFIYERCSGRH